MPPWLARTRQWATTIAEFALAQGIGQAAGMLAGLIYVRTMPVEQYALYALCLTALGVIAVGSDLGLTGSLGYFWRKSLQDGTPFAPKVALVQRLRGYLFVAASAIAVLLVASSTRSMTIPTSAIIVGLALIAATAWIQTRIAIEILLVRLEGRQRESYYFETAGSVVRLCAAAAMLVSGIASAWFGLAGGLLGAVVTIALLGRATGQGAREVAAPSRADWHEIRAYLVPLLPSVFVYMVQDPLILWLAAVQGGPIPVAELHALGRITAIYALVGTFSYVVMTPRLAGISDNRRYVLITCTFLSILVTISAALLIAVRSTPGTVLLLIGERYAHLGSELVVLLAASSLAMLTWFLNLANRGRGWIALDPVFALLQLTTIITLCMIWSFDTTAQLVLLTLALNGTALCASATTLLLGIFRPDLVTVRQLAHSDKT